MNSGELILQFGIHQGKPLKEVPANYLKYMMSFNNLNPQIKIYLDENRERIEIESLAEKQHQRAKNKHGNL